MISQSHVKACALGLASKRKGTHLRQLLISLLEVHESKAIKKYWAVCVKDSLQDSCREFIIWKTLDEGIGLDKLLSPPAPYSLQVHWLAYVMQNNVVLHGKIGREGAFSQEKLLFREPSFSATRKKKKKKKVIK